MMEWETRGVEVLCSSEREGSNSSSGATRMWWNGRHAWLSPDSMLARANPWYVLKLPKHPVHFIRSQLVKLNSLRQSGHRNACNQPIKAIENA